MEEREKSVAQSWNGVCLSNRTFYPFVNREVEGAATLAWSNVLIDVEKRRSRGDRWAREGKDWVWTVPASSKTHDDRISVGVACNSRIC
jgi:hypothetical protein